MTAVSKKMIKNKSKIFSRIKFSQNNDQILQKKINIFFQLLNITVKTKPYLVVIVLHEYLRNLYPEDMFLKFTENNHKKRIAKTLKQLTELIELSNKIKSYNIKFKKELVHKNLIQKNDQVFSKIFIAHKNKIHEKKYLKNLKNLGLDKKYFKNKYILDAGTGAGRHAKIFSYLSARKIIAVDSKLTIKKNLKEIKIKNVIYKEGNVLNLKFRNSVFDFVNCYGVLHHTSSIDKGIQELLRVLKKGGFLFLCIYGKGGIFWDSRKKMNKLFKQIPQDYTAKIFEMINVPKERFVFEDCWYAPIETHTYKKKLEQMLSGYKINSFKKIINKNFEKNKKIWGDGDLLYLIKK